MSEGEGDIVQEGNFKGWPKADIEKLGNESEQEVRSLRETWKVIKEDDTKTAFDTGGGIYVEDKATGRLTRVGDKAVTKSDKYIFTIFDGWTSHSYPNPGFSGNPSDNGKMSIRGYEWEINYLAPYHLPNKSPIFITETGWVNNGRDQEKNR